MWSGGWGVSVSPCLLEFRMFFFGPKGKGKVAIGSFSHCFMVNFSQDFCLFGWLSLRLSKLVRSFTCFFSKKE